MGPRQKPWGTPHSKLNIYWYLLCARYVCARYLLCAKYLFLTFRRCSRGRHGCRHWQQWIKNEKTSIQIFFSTRQTRNFLLKILHVHSFHSKVESLLFYFIIIITIIIIIIISSSLPSLLFNKYLSLTFRSCCRWWHSCRHWKVKTNNMQSKQYLQTGYFLTSNMSIADCCCHLSCCTIQPSSSSQSLSSSTLSSSSSSSSPSSPLSVIVE